VRQQYTWFRLDDPRIHWFDMDEEGVEAAVNNFVRDWRLGVGDREER
jgi:hypothetical protein